MGSKPPVPSARLGAAADRCAGAWRPAAGEVLPKKAFHLLLSWLGLVATLALAALPPPAPAALPALPPPARAGVLPAVLGEASGLAASRRADHLVWAHNDSGGEAVLYALDTNGKLRGKLRIEGVKNTDWEDIASFELDGRAWLLIADTGDNNDRRQDCALLIIAEPDPADLAPDRELNAPVAWRVPVRWPDGPHDCEAVAVDAHEEKAYLLTKRTSPPALYTLPLRAPGGVPLIVPFPLPGGGQPSAATGEPPTSTLVARLVQIPPPTPQEKLSALPTGRYRAEPTALDFAPDGSAAVVLTYGDVWLFRRAPSQSWTDAFAAPQPGRLAPHGLLQAEAACFSRDGRTLFVTGELPGAALVRYDLPPAAQP